MHTITLSENWQLASGRELLRAQPQEPDFLPQSWLPVSVPCTAQSALVGAGRAPDPWLDAQAKAFGEFEDERWWYRTEFTPECSAADTYELVFEGVSLFATVWLNGHAVGYIHNAHYTHTFDVTAYISPNERNAVSYTHLRAHET